MYTWWNANVDGPRPNSKGPNSGDKVGGVCPDEAECAVNRASRVSSATRIDCSTGSRGSMKAPKCVSG